MIKITNGLLEPYTLVLSTRNMTHLGQITGVSDVNIKVNMNGANELSFTIDKDECFLWDEIYDLRLVWVKELKEYYEIEVSINESLAPQKSVTGKSLCEAELSQTILRNVEINSESDIDRDDYKPTKFYNDEDVSLSLLHRILNKCPNYQIGHVDHSLVNLQRTFSIDGTSIYDFLVGDCSEQFNCLFTFDSETRTVNAYDLYTVCEDCGYRGEYNDVCPECGSHNIKYYGEDTTICVGIENLTDEIQYSTDVGSIKNCFYLKAGDDYMTSTIVNCNPNGSQYIYYFPEETLHDMSDELRERLKTYNNMVELYTDEYDGYVNDWYEAVDNYYKYKDSMMPGYELGTINASSEAKRIEDAANDGKLSPIALSSITTSTLNTTIESAIEQYLKLFVHTGYVKIKAVTTFVMPEQGKAGLIDSAQNRYKTWDGYITVTSYTDDKDVKDTKSLRIKVYDNYSEYVNQKFIKQLQKQDSDYFLYDPLGTIKDTSLDNFKKALKEYSLSRLESFSKSIGAALTVLQEAGLGSPVESTNPKHGLYESLYYPYYERQLACDDEIKIRSVTVDHYKDEWDKAVKNMNEIHDILNFNVFLGETLLKEFASFRREDTYDNSNYISDGLDNSEIIKQAKDFIDEAKKEVVKSGEYQHQISSTLNNLLIIPEFAPIVDKFKLGNWIRLKVNGDIYRLRLSSIGINGSDIANLEVEFTDLTKTANGVNDVRSILDKASSMATSYSYVSKQASKGDEAKDSVDDWVKSGLDSSLVNVINNNDEEIVIDSAGVTAKSYDDIMDDYEDEQLRITHNIIAFTDDNWKTTTLGIGKHTYPEYNPSTDIFENKEGYGVTGKFMTAGHIYGSEIISGKQYSKNYSSLNKNGSMINWETGEFSLAGDKLTYNPENDKLNYKGNFTIIGGDFTVKDSDDKVIFKADIDAKSVEIGGFTVTNKSLYKGTSNLSSTTVGTYIGTDGIRNYKDSTHNFTVKDGVISAYGADISGIITATSGYIGTDSDTRLALGEGYLSAGNPWDTSSTGIYLGTGSKGSHKIGDSSVRNGWAIVSGGKFGVTNDGELYAESAHIKGNITGSTGTFGSVTLNDNGLSSSNFSIDKNGNATIKGTINSGSVINSGTSSSPTQLGAWKVTNASDGGTDFWSSVTKDGTSRITGMSTSGNAALAVGATSGNWSTTAPFWVSHDGKVTAQNIVITSEDSKNPSCIGNFYISSGDYYTLERKYDCELAIYPGGKKMTADNGNDYIFYIALLKEDSQTHIKVPIYGKGVYMAV